MRNVLHTCVAAFVFILLPSLADGAMLARTDRAWDVLPDGANDPRAALRVAGERLGDRRIHVFEVPVDGSTLREIAGRTPEEPFVRVVREALRRPVDVEDFLYFLDDLLAAGAPVLEDDVWLPSGRARNAGVLLHPDDVFAESPRRYGTGDPLDLSRPAVPAELEPAEDGDPPGARWTARYENPTTEEAMLDALERENPSGTFTDRIRSLLRQLRAQDAECWVHSTVRSRERGYLIWGSFLLSRADGREEVMRRIARLNDRNRAWGLHVPIQWRHPDGWRATVAGAHAMAEAYNVVYATEAGARRSRHYGGRSVDFTAVGLPRNLRLVAPNGATGTFDLSAPEEPRDLSLQSELIRWVERHFRFEKVRSDYPHWNDAAEDGARASTKGSENGR